MKHRNHSKQELRKASNALNYEVSMLRFLVRALPCPIFGQGVGPIRNALIESFATHARVLIEFFYPSQNPHEDTILAKHFFSPPNKWTQIPPPKSKTLSEAKTRADKLLAHLTYTRCKEPLNKEWPITKIGNELEIILDIFLREVAKDLLGSRWKTNPQSHTNKKN